MSYLWLVGAGGFLGSVTRYALSRFIETNLLSSFPYGTFTVNLIGCLAIGIIYGLSLQTTLSSEVRLFLAAGFCGGFTTFSTFSYETLTLLQDAQYLFLFYYVAGSVILGLLAAYLGLAVAKLLMG